MRCHREVERLDAALASLAREETGLRLRLGQVLEVLGRGRCFELGFSSLAAYALERCDRSVRWVECARCLARRLDQLPELRRAMVVGSVSWSMGELLARVARPEDESRWIEAAESRTVREMRGRVLDAIRERQATGLGVSSPCVAGGAGLNEHAPREAGMKEPAVNGARFDERSAAGAGFDERSASGAGLGGRSLSEAGMNERSAGPGLASDPLEDGDGDEMCTLTCTVDQEEAWLYEATRALLVQLGVHGSDAQVEALLAEGQDTLLGALPAGTLDLDRVEAVDTAQRRWFGELSRWRADAEACCEEHFRGSVVGNGRAVDAKKVTCMRSGVANAAALGLACLEDAGCHDLDRMLRGLSRLLARHELELCELVLEFHRANGWRRLGYASEAQYARERMGVSRSSLVARRALALRLEKLPRVAKALGSGQIGVEAAVQVVRVATPSTQLAWVERARRRTIKHLREEVAAALIAVRMSGEANCPPPMDAEMTAFHGLEQAVVSGRACQPRPAKDGPVKGDVDGVRLAQPSSVRLTEPGSGPRRAWLVMLGSLARWLEGGLQMSAAPDGAPATNVGSKGRIVLRWRVSRANAAWWRGLEAQARPWLPSGMSWLRSLCLSLWSAWRHLLGRGVAYGHIYIRDRCRCSSPVCNRRDVTPHHLRFRSAGGSDEAENITSVCTWCHLFGVHGGRIRAVGKAGHIRWDFGTPGRPCLIVDGRERVAVFE